MRTSKLSPSMYRFCVSSKFTLSSAQGRKVPVDRFCASRRLSALPCHSNLYFSKSLSMYSPHRDSSCKAFGKHRTQLVHVGLLYIHRKSVYFIRHYFVPPYRYHLLRLNIPDAYLSDQIPMAEQSREPFLLLQCMFPMPWKQFEKSQVFLQQGY